MSETKLGLGATDTIGDRADPATSETVAAGSVDPARSETVASGSEPALAPGRQLVRGEQIDRFVVLGTLGKGGMGVVYSAYDPQLDRKVAIKLLSGDAANADAQTRLLREAQAMAKIRHPNVIVVHDVGTYRDQVYVAMEFADGGTLRAWLASAPRDQREILEVFVQAGRGLAAAHAAGLVHRDFKPDNVLRSRDGRVHVTDFGLVGVMSEHETTERPTRPPTDYEKPVDTGPTPLHADLTQTGAVMGTPRYMAPEQFQGATATARADQFAFCVALYEALYGERPFAGTSFAELCANVVSGTMEPPPKNARVPAWLRRALLRGLSKDPAARYPTVDALLAALSRAPQRKGIALALGGLVVVAATAGIAIAAHPSHRSPCEGGGDHVRTAWSPARRDAMRAAFLATKRPLAASIFDRSAALVDTWTKSWQDGYVAACEATRVHGEQSEHLLDLRMQCLDRKLGEVGAMISTATTGGADAVDHALDAFGALPLLVPCADATALLAEVSPPESTVARAQVAQVRAQLDAVRSAAKLGKLATSLELARTASTAAGATGYAPLIAEADIAVGNAQIANGQVSTAVTTLRDAMHAAARAGDTVTMLSASSALLHALNEEGKRFDNAEEVAGIADALADHAHPATDVYVFLQEEIARVDENRNRLDVAQTRLEKTVGLAEKELGPDNAVTLTAVAVLGALYRDRGRYAEAEKMFGRVVASDEHVLGKDHPSLASALTNLAIVYRHEGKLAETKTTLDRALAIDRAALGPDHPVVAEVLNSMGNFAQEAGDDATALDDFEQAKVIWEKAYGGESAAMETVLANLGSVQQSLKRDDQARENLTKALAISEKLEGHDNRHELDIYNSLALVAFDEKRLDDALAAFQHARTIAVAVSGPDSGDIVDIDMNIANVYSRKGQLEDSLALQRATIGIAEKAYGPQHPRVGMLLANLAMGEDKLKRYADALADFERAIPIFVAKFGEDHMYTLQVVTQSAEELMALKRYADAVPYFERAVAIGGKVDTPPGLIDQIKKELAQARARAPRSHR